MIFGKLYFLFSANQPRIYIDSVIYEFERIPPEEIDPPEYFDPFSPDYSFFCSDLIALSKKQRHLPDLVFLYN